MLSQLKLSIQVSSRSFDDGRTVTNAGQWLTEGAAAPRAGGGAKMGIKTQEKAKGYRFRT
jgi:hypothetical protein